MKFDLEGSGLGMVLLPWQVEAMRILWERGAVDSRTVHEALGETEHAMSRASVINFLNGMVDKGYLAFVEETGKGGWKRIWKPVPEAAGERAFRQRVTERVHAKLLDFAGGA